MPFPLPWFDNKPDPLLPQPQNIKPYLYSLDDYQTYDLLVFVLPKYLSYPFFHSLKLPLFLTTEHSTPSFLKPILIERFTPWDYPWAEDYSTKFFNLLTPYAYSCLRVLDIEEPTLEFREANKTTFNYSSNLTIDDFPYKLEFSFDSKRDDVIVITWLELTIETNEIIKRYKIINLGQGENNLKIIFPNQVLSFSIVISGSEQIKDFESKLEELHPSWLYKNLNSFINEINGYFSNLSGGFFQNFNKQKAKWIKYMSINIRDDSPHKTRIINLIAGLETTNGHVSLLYANNNYWKNQININIDSDLGKPIFYQAVYQQNPFSIINVVAKLNENVDLSTDPYNYLYEWAVGANDIDLDIDKELSPTIYFPYLIGARDNVPWHIALMFYEAKKQTELSQETETMPDSIRIKEIHEALNAYKYALDDKGQPRVANLGYYIERIARVLGISVNPDGSIRSIRQSKFVPQGEPIPPGWSIGQWGRNQGGSNAGQTGGLPEHDKDGLAYEVRSGRFEIDQNTGEPTEMQEGGYVLIENLPQLLHIIMDDFDKSLGMQDLGALVLPKADQTDIASFEGLASLNAEIAYMLSALSTNITQTHISNLKCQAMLQEVLAAIGAPVELKAFQVDVGEEEPVNVPYPGLREDAPSMADMSVWILSNLAPLVASQLSIDLEKTD
jgi:hypothetical protein